MDVLTNRPLAAAALSTLAPFAALPGPPQSCVTWCEETDAPYLFVPGDVTAIDGVTSIAPTGGTAGRWLLGSEIVSIKPIDGIVDDWPRLNTIMAACAAKATVALRAGAWRCATPGMVPSDTKIEMESGVVITSAMASTGGQTNSVFYAQSALVAGTTTLTSNTIPGLRTINVTSVAAPVISIGTLLYLSNGLQSQFYTVTNVAALVVTLDRPINWTCPSATGVVGTYTRVPTNIIIEGNGATVLGTGDRVIEIGAPRFCRVSDLIVSDAGGRFSNSVFAFDVGGFGSTFERCHLRYQIAGTFYGVALESCEASSIVECESIGCTYNIALVDCISCSAIRCQGSKGTAGVFVGYDAALAGCFDCQVIGGTYSANTTGGVMVDGGSGTGAVRTKIVGVSTLGNTTGMFLARQTKTTVTACSGDSDTTGVSVTATSVDLTISDYSTHANDTGLTFAIGALGTKLANITTDTTATFGIAIGCEMKIVGLSIKNATNRCVYWATLAGTSLIVEGFDFQLVGAGVPQHVEIYGGAGSYVTFRDGKLTNTASCFGFVLQVASTVLTLENVIAVNASNQSGVFANAGGLVRRKGYVDLSTFTTPFAAGTAVYGWGSNQLTANNPVAVPFADLKIGEIPKYVFTTLAGGTGLGPVFVMTPGTGFTMTALIGDTSTVSWELD